jgi:hypothetical protein
MAEVEIKRTNFFDGEFLKQGEFIDLDAYHMHMRRRLLFVLFDKSGVIQAGPTDLAVEVANAAQKQIRIKAGLAIGKRPDLAEAKEIVVRDDRLIDLNTQNLQPGDTGIVTVHYDELFTDPSSEGGVLGNTRVKEQAVVTVHKNNLPGPNAPNNEPFVRLGNVAFNNLALDITQRQVAFLQVSLLAASPTISVSPNQVTAGLTVPLTVTSSPGFNLSALTAAQVAITPNTGISNITVSNQASNGATVTITLAANAPAGPRTITITVNHVAAQTTFAVQGGLALANFQGVDEPNNDLLFKINGSGFQTPVVIQFTKFGGGLTPAVPLAVTAQNTSPNQILIPMAQIPADAVTGPVTVTSGNQTVVSGFNVVPPAIITAVPAQAQTQTNINITGSRFTGTTAITLPGNLVRATNSVPAFPSGPFGESLTDVLIVVRLISNTGANAKVRVTTPGGTVQSPNFLSVT